MITSKRLMPSASSSMGFAYIRWLQELRTIIPLAPHASDRPPGARMRRGRFNLGVVFLYKPEQGDQRIRIDGEANQKRSCAGVSGPAREHGEKTGRHHNSEEFEPARLTETHAPRQRIDHRRVERARAGSNCGARRRTMPTATQG
ncbi:hypothetical protein NKH95_01500 [Mesorhizobium sp. M0848]|uniref:hypothetical protein n=1 Tax=Mesorhizobium sp. M0848 TaxID=2957012 RepID=UPI00333A016C